MQLYMRDFRRIWFGAGLILFSKLQRRSLRERKKRNYNDDYDYNISDDEEKKKAENGESVNLAVAGGHKLIAYKPSDAVEGEIATIERILAGRVQATVKVFILRYCCCFYFVW